MTPRAARRAGLPLLLALALSACSTGGDQPAGGTSSGSEQTLTVLAAASLTYTFTELADDFEAEHPGGSVRLSFGGSSDLATQITSGAPADVFASAATKNMDAVVAAGRARNPVTFARNSLEIAVPPSNPGKVTALSDLTSTSVKVALCQPEVPCGAASTKLFTAQKMTVKPVTLEPDVKSVLTKVQLNEVDAGLVYATDVKAAAGKVTGIAIPADKTVWTTYPIAAIEGSAQRELADQFVAHVTGEKGRAVLAEAGFASAS